MKKKRQETKEERHILCRFSVLPLQTPMLRPLVIRLVLWPITDQISDTDGKRIAWTPKVWFLVLPLTLTKVCCWAFA